MSEAPAILRDYLINRDVACPVCTYNQRDNPTDRCPECGSTMTLSIGSDHVRTGPWVLMLIGAALPFGFAVTFLIINTMFVLYGSGSGDQAPALAMAIVYGIVLAAVIALRRVVLRQAPAIQWFCAILVFLVCSICWTLLFLGVLS